MHTEATSQFYDATFVRKNTAQIERYVSAIQSLVEKGSNSYDSPSRIGSTPCKGKSRHGKSTVGKVVCLVYVLHEDVSISDETYLVTPTPSASCGCHSETQ